MGVVGAVQSLAEEAKEVVQWLHKFHPRYCCTMESGTSSSLTIYQLVILCENAMPSIMSSAEKEK